MSQKIIDLIEALEVEISNVLELEGAQVNSRAWRDVQFYKAVFAANIEALDTIKFEDVSGFVPKTHEPH